MATQERKRRWYHPTPARFFIGLLVVQVFLLLSERFQWFAFNEHKGWTVLIAVGVVGIAVLVMLAWGLVSLVLRRRFHFGFRSLLVFLMAVSVPLGWFAWEMQRARNQREAVEVIRELEGEVWYNNEVKSTRRVRWPPPPPQPTTPSWFCRLLGDDLFSEVVMVTCNTTKFTDDDARHLRRLNELECLSLDNTEISDSSLVHLAGMTKLEFLSLNNTQISDTGLVHLAGMTKLEFLSLDNTQISDTGLYHLKGLTRLRMLCPDNTQVTDEAIEKLLPNCVIVR